MKYSALQVLVLAIIFLIGVSLIAADTTVETLIKDLGDKDPQVRVRAAKELGAG